MALSLRWTDRFRSFLRKFQSSRVSLIDDKNLEVLLKEIDHWQDLAKGALHCSRCEKILTLENLSGFVTNEDGYDFFCDSQNCLAVAHRTK
jgi:hypothetical protein